MVRKAAVAITAAAASLWLLVGSSAYAAVAAQPEFVNTLMPQPAQLTARNGRLELGAGLSAIRDRFSDERLDAAIGRMLTRLSDQTGTRQVSAAARAAVGQARLLVSVEGPGQFVQSIDEDESYTLEVTSQGAHLTAKTDVGAIHGLETLLQLVQTDGTTYFIPAVSIRDQPRFPWRGLMIDCSRHFEPIEKIERTLDAMAAVKMNVFHWHLTDDQGFRIESLVFPKLTGMGSDGEYYTQRQAREIVAYARDRGIRVVPEFDMPGHATAWMVGYPSLASAPGPFAIERHFGIFDPVMDPTRESTYAFLDKFIAEMATIFPDHYLHIGGDENNGVEWRQNARIQAFMRAHHLEDTAALQGYFDRRIFLILKRHGKEMVGWDEIMSPNLPNDVVVQSWRGFKSLAAGAKQGYRGILSAGYYLGHSDSTAAFYRVDPLPADSNLNEAEARRILGGEVCSWGEYVNARTIDSRNWPATAAVAERLWSPRTVNNVDDMYRRLETESLRLEALGLTHLTQEDADLRALAGTAHIHSLQTLAGVLEPVGFSIRGPWSEAHGVSQLDPLDHLVDALPPDPMSRHEFEKLVNRYLQDPLARQDEKAQLTLIFRTWIAASPEALRLISAAPLLAEARPRALELAELGNLGLEATSYLSAGGAAPAGWKQRQLDLLREAEKPVALVQFTSLEPLRDLVNAVEEPQ